MLYVRNGKRFLDIVVSAIGLVVLSPFLIIVAAVVRLASPGPAFFRQVRVGQFGKPFRMLKFRSMVGKPQGRGDLLTAAGDPRITRIGRWLRSTKVDELPKIINVFLGDMSLIGPRPEVPMYVALYDERQKTILNARPGVSGISANVREEELMAGREDKEAFYISTIMPAKLEFDISYCQNISLRTDLRILFTTLNTVMARVLELHMPVPRPEKETP